MAAYVENTHLIQKLNDMPDGGEYGHTHFSDLTSKEFQKLYFPLRKMDPEIGKAG